MVIRTRDGQGHDDRLARAVAGGDARRLVLRERRGARVRRRALQRPVGRGARHRRRLGPGAAPLRHAVARPGAAPGHPRGPRGFVVDDTFVVADRGQRRVVRRHALDRRSSTSMPTARRATRAPSLRNPDLAAHLPPDRAGAARAAFYSGPSRRARSSTRPAARPIGAGRRPRLAPRACSPRTTSPPTPRPSASPPTSTTAASTSGAWARPRAAARRSARRSTSSRAIPTSAPTGRWRCTSSSRPRGFSFADRNAYLGRPGVLRRAARRACSPTTSPPSAAP